MSLRGKIRCRLTVSVAFVALQAGGCVSSSSKPPGGDAAGGGGGGVQDGGVAGAAGNGVDAGGMIGGAGGNASPDAATGVGGGPGAGGNGGAIGGSGGGSPNTGGTTGGIGGAGGGVVLTSPLVIDVSTASNPVVPGQRLLYTITVGNVSSRAVDGVAVLLRVPTGLAFNYINDAEPNTTCGNCVATSEARWALGSIPAGTTQTIMVNAAVLQTVGNGDTISTPVTLTATGVNPINITKIVQVFATPSAQLALGSLVGPATPNQGFTFDLDVGQLGATAVTGAQLRTSIPAGLTVGTISDGGTQESPGQIVWNLGGLPVGSVFHRKVDVTVDAGVSPGSVLAAHATLAYDGGVAVDAAADSPVSIVGVAPALRVEIGVASSPVVPDARALYTMTVSNVSTRAVDTVTVLLRTPQGLAFNYINDTEPNTTCGNCVVGSEAFWSLGTIAAGASVTITLNAVVLATAVGDGNLISAPFTVSGVGVNDINVSKTIQVFSRPAAQLALGTVTNPALPGQALTLDLDVGQIGVNALTATELRLSLPPGVTVTSVSDAGTQPTPRDAVWAIGGLAVSAVTHRSVAVTVNADVPPGTILAAHASLTYDGGVAVDALADYAVSVAPAAIPLTLVVSATPNPVLPGTRVLYTATVANTSARAVDGISLLFRLPPGLAFNYINDAEPNTTCGNCVAGSEAFWAVTSLAAGATQVITVNAAVLATVLEGSLIPARFGMIATGMTDQVVVQSTVPAHH